MGWNDNESPRTAEIIARYTCSLIEAKGRDFKRIKEQYLPGERALPLNHDAPGLCTCVVYYCQCQKAVLGLSASMVVLGSN